MLSAGTSFSSGLVQGSPNAATAASRVAISICRFHLDRLAGSPRNACAGRPRVLALEVGFVFLGSGFVCEPAAFPTRTRAAAFRTLLCCSTHLVLIAVLGNQ